MDTTREIIAEVQRATSKFPKWPTDPIHAMAVVHEEIGELAKEVLQMTYEPHKTSAAEVRKEAVQAAAMLLRFVASLDRYVYRGCKQHEQDGTASSPMASHYASFESEVCVPVTVYYGLRDGEVELSQVESINPNLRALRWLCLPESERANLLGQARVIESRKTA